MIVSWKRWIYLAWLCLIPLAGNAVTPMIAAGGESLFLNSDGSVWGAGSVTNYYPGATSPVPLLRLPNVVAVATTSATNFALPADGTLWGSGGNGQGQLGDGSTQYRSKPQRVPGLSGIKAVATSTHVLALKEDGTVWAWGQNDRGQLGDGTKTDRYAPAQVIGLTNITNISASSGSSLALRVDGTVWVWGFTAAGAAGNGLQPSNDADPEMYHLIPTQVRNLDQVMSVTAGGVHHMALRADGTVWTWGMGILGENGTGLLSNQLLLVKVPGLDQVVAIDAKGQNLSLALRANGTVWAWGSNSMGRLGSSGITFSATPIQVSGLSDIVAISSGFNHVLAMRRDGIVLSWGWNGSGQLGDGTLQDHADPRPVSGPGGNGRLNLLQPAPTSFNQLPSGQISLSGSSGTAPLTVQATAINANDPDGTINAYYWKSSNGSQALGPSTSFVFPQAGAYDIDLLIEDNVGGRGSARQQVVVTAAAAGAISASPKVAVGPQSGIALANDGHVLTWGQNALLGFYNAQAQSTLPKANSLPMRTVFWELLMLLLVVRSMRMHCWLTGQF